MDQRVRDELAEHTEGIAAEDRIIAQAHARRIDRLLAMQDWSEDPRVSSRLHGTLEGIHTADRNAATMTEDQARAAAHARWDEHKIARRTIVTETACLTRTSERTIEHQLDEARLLYSHAPATFDALSRGEISYRHATTLLDQIRTLPDEDQAAFEEKVLPVAKTQPVGRFKDRARRLRERLHPESIVTRSTDALKDRRTWWEPAQDGMGWLHWYGTAEQTKAAWDRITGMATGVKNLGDPTPASAENVPASTGTGAAFGLDQKSTEEPPARTLDQLRADVTAALLLDGITPTGMGAGIHGTVMVTVPMLTLLGWDEEPASLEGYGPISPDAARRIAGNVPGFTRILTHPESGVILSVGDQQYKVTKGMRKALRMRDETCRFPGCSRPAAKSDIDHTQDWQYDGGTDLDNLAHLCEGHHRLKHLSQWSVIQEPGGVLVWTSPGKRTYRTDPANPIGPPRPAPPTVGPRTRKQPADDSFLIPRHRPTRHPSPPVPENPPF
jgi:hypothetical protein